LKKQTLIIDDLKTTAYFMKKEYENLKKEKDKSNETQAEINKELEDSMRMFKVKIRESAMGVEKIQKEVNEKLNGGMFGFGMGFEAPKIDEEFASEIRGDIRKLNKELKQLEHEMKDEKLRVEKELKAKFDKSELEAIEQGILTKSEEQISKCVKRMAEKVELTVQI